MRPVAVLNKPKLIGVVSSDSGCLTVLDPCHLGISEAGAIRLPNWNLYTRFDTEVGDGEFTVYEQRDSRGRLRRVVIELE
jgi:hypothetical protein